MSNPLCKEDSLDILDNYKSQLTDKQYERIASVIGHQSIEGLYPTQKSIDRMVRLELGKITPDQALTEILQAK